LLKKIPGGTPPAALFITALIAERGGRTMKRSILSLSGLALACSTVWAEPLLEFRLKSADEIYSEQALPSAAILTSEIPYNVEVPQNDGSVENVERISTIYATLPDPEISKPKHHYRLDDDIAVDGKFPKSIILEGLDKTGDLYIRTFQQFHQVKEERGLYRAEKPATQTELVKESKFLAELNQFRKDNGLEPFSLSVPKLTPFTVDFVNSLDRGTRKIPKAGRLKYISALTLRAPSEEIPLFGGNKQVSYFEGYGRAFFFLNRTATTIDLAMVVPEAEKGLIGDAKPPERVFMIIYTPE
jgi:hypothetical protein